MKRSINTDLESDSVDSLSDTHACINAPLQQAALAIPPKIYDFLTLYIGGGQYQAKHAGSLISVTFHEWGSCKWSRPYWDKST